MWQSAQATMPSRIGWRERRNRSARRSAWQPTQCGGQTEQLGLGQAVAGLDLLDLVEHRVPDRMDLMAGGAGLVGGLMLAHVPVDPVAALVAVQADLVLLLRGGPGVLAEPPVGGRPLLPLRRLLQMLLAGAVTGLTLIAGEGRVGVGRLGVLGVKDQRGRRLVVALEADLRAAPGDLGLRQLSRAPARGVVGPGGMRRGRRGREGKEKDRCRGDSSRSDHLASPFPAFGAAPIA